MTNGKVHVIIQSMALLRRHRDEQHPGLDQSTGAYANDDPGLTAEGFLDNQEGSLVESRSLWTAIAGKFTLFEADGEFLGTVHGALDIYIADQERQHGMTPQQKQSLEQRLYATSRKLPSDLGPYFLTIASHAAAQNKGLIGSSTKFGRDSWNLPDTLVAQIVRYALLSEKKKHLAPFGILPDEIKNANNKGRIIVSDFAQALGKRPALLAEFMEMKDNQALLLLEELKKLCAVDWYGGDQDSSHLKRCLKHLEDNDELYLDDFVLAIEDSTYEDKLGRIREMSRFALASAGLGIGINASLRQPILDSREHWPEFDIDKAFAEFRKVQTAQLQRSLSSFIGNEFEARRNIRFPRTASDVAAAQARFAGYFDHSRDVRRGQRRRAVEILGRSATPSLKEIIGQGQIPGRSKGEETKIEPTMTLGSVWRDHKGEGHIKPIEKDDLLKDFDSSPQLKNELSRMLDELLGQPDGPGTAHIKGRSVRVTIGQKRMTIRRFSPLDRPGFSTTEERAKKYRITYVLVDGCVAIIDIMDHKSFDLKYK